MIEDEILKWKFKNASPDALERIYEKYENYLLTVAMGLLNNEAAAEDVLHDVFVNFAQNNGSFKISGSLKSYLSTCVVNRARDIYRKKRLQAASIEDFDTLCSKSNDPEQSIIYSEQTKIANDALSQLPYEQRETIVLHIKGQLKFREIARLQNASMSTVQGRYRYGIEKLRSILNSEVKNETGR